MFAAAYVVFVALMSGRPPLWVAVWEMIIHGGGSAWIAWGLILATGIAAFFLRGRAAGSDRTLMAILIVEPVGWITGDILYRAQSVENAEYWSYFADPTMFRWLLAPWFSGYSLALSFACLGLWAATLPTSPNPAR
ncbi:hypothetical protein [uncultured Brevundimonas sp.]|uniref:hypothetical protein n=1 Tax=uncultured Brevundimonas sp. TaxID=213418 RepID=UPI0030EB1781